MKARIILPNQMLRDLYQALPDLWLQNISGELPWDKQREIMHLVGHPIMQAVVRHRRVAEWPAPMVAGRRSLLP